MTTGTAERDGEYTEPPEQLQHFAGLSIGLPAATAQTMLDTLRHVDEFLRCHASPAALAELDAYCTAQGWAPACGSGVLIDRIGLHALALHDTITTATTAAAIDCRKELP